MSDKTPKAVPRPVRSLSSKDQLLVCKLTGFQVGDNLALKKDDRQNTVVGKWKKKERDTGNKNKPVREG